MPNSLLAQAAEVLAGTAMWAVAEGDCVEVLRGLPNGSVDAVVCDPPYGLEFLGKEWDSFKNWESGGGFSSPGIGDRPTQWPSFSATGKHGAANPTCAKCGGRARGKKKCSCVAPGWKPIGKRKDPKNEPPPDDATDAGMPSHMLKYQAWCATWAAEALRVLKPGGHLLAFGGTRTAHRLVCAIEDAGFEVRDMLAFLWLHAQGFPKSLNVEKAINRHLGAEREVVGTKATNFGLSSGKHGKQEARISEVPATAPATEEAKRWEGWGTSLKPAYEPIVLARKPLGKGTVAANVLAHGTGALNIDAARIRTNENLDGGAYAAVGGRSPIDGDERSGAALGMFKPGKTAERDYMQPTGRYPANVALGHVESVWYAVRNDAPQEVVALIHGLYGADRAVPSLRQADEAEEAVVLRSGVRLRVAASRAPKASGDDLVPKLPSVVQGVLVPSEERSAEVLLKNLPRDVLGEPAESPPTRKASDAGSSGKDLGDTEKPALHPGAGITVEGGPLRPRRVRPHHGGYAASEGESDGPSDGPSALGLRPGASGRRVDIAGASSEEVGGSPPSERAQVGQPPGESPRRAEDGALNLPPQSRTGAAPTSGRSGEAQSRELLLEVHESLIPASWILWFRVSSRDGCVRVGVKKVKGITGTKSGSWRKGHQYSGGWKGAPEAELGEAVGHADAEGMETVESWRCVEGCPVRELDTQSGDSASPSADPKIEVRSRDQRDTYGTGKGFPGAPTVYGYGDAGGASRFFYCAKAGANDRWFWCADCGEIGRAHV